MKAFLFAVFLILVAPAAIAVEKDANEAVYNLSGEIVGGEADTLAEIAKWAVRGHASTLVIRINTPGGSMTEALALYRVIRDAGLPTRCEVPKDAEADSGGFLALQACQVRVMHRTAHLLTHRPAVVIPRPIVMSFEMMKVTWETLDAGSNVFDALIAQRLGMKLEDYRVHVADGVPWKMDATQALAAHAVDMVAM